MMQHRTGHALDNSPSLRLSIRTDRRVFSAGQRDVWAVMKLTAWVKARMASGMSPTAWM